MKEQLPIQPEGGDVNTGGTSTGTTPTPTTTKNTEPLAWYQDERFLLGAFVFIVIVWLAATFLA